MKRQELDEIQELFEASFTAFKQAYRNHRSVPEDEKLIIRAEHAVQSVEDTMLMYREILSSFKTEQTRHN